MATTNTSDTNSSLLPLWGGRLLVVAGLLVVVQGVVQRAPHLSGLAALAAWAGAALFLLGFPLAFERPSALSLTLSGTGAVLITFTVAGNASFVAVIATVAMAGRFLEARVSRSIAALAGLGYIAAVTTTNQISARNILGPAAGLLFAYMAADTFRRLRLEQRQTQALLQEVIEGRDAQIQAAALDERARLAREIHDILAHTLSALTVQLEGTRLLLEQRAADPAALAALDRARRLAHEGLDETKRAVVALRENMAPAPRLLAHLAANFQEDAGIPSRLEIEGQPVELPPEAQLALYRTAQEALTNIRKHAAASAVTIRLRYAPTGVELTVENQGAARPEDWGGSGYGLRGLRERAVLVGGSLEAGPTEAGFKVGLWLPT